MPLGESWESTRLRIYLAGQICLEAGHTRVEERQFPSRQGRLVLAYLTCERLRAISRDELGEAVWSGGLPPAWPGALSALVSKLRHLLQTLGLLPGTVSIISHAGCYQLYVPSDTWVDHEAATQALHEAEGSLTAGTLTRAWGAANVAVAIARRLFLPQEEGLWVELQSSKL
jgi:DNA-binding SARP family transcriptional activator